MRLGLVDHNLDNFHANVYLRAFRGELANRGFTVAGATAIEEAASRKWAEANRIPYYDHVAELASHVDAFLILAPSNPETHLPLCESVFPHGKISFVDKTFAPDLATAKQIFALADRHGVAMQTTSALRTTNVQPRLRELDVPVSTLFVSAGGSTFAEYGIHPVELAVSCLGAGAITVTTFGNDEDLRIVMQFTGNRAAIIDFVAQQDLPFTVAAVSPERYDTLTVDLDRLFTDAASAMLDFFTAGQALIDRRETLLIRRVLDIANDPALRNTFVPLDNLLD
jgi:hypothetical protein